MANVMFWRRYRSTLGWAAIASPAVGAALGLAIYASGNADYRAQAGWSGFAYWLAIGAVLGLGTGLAALVGGTVCLVARDRDFARNSASRITFGTLGASIGAALAWVAVGVAALPGSIAWWPLFVGLAVAAALVAATVARILLGRAERRQDGDVVELRFNV
ncbi:hypothetical protein [Microbacterium sp. CH-015]|uniref:hypothetical protein n=1 Tax=Microbacterium sp. CH-015 TaxID=3406734 RepID=UPI003C773085